MGKNKTLKVAILLFVICGGLFAAWQFGLFGAIPFPGLPIPGASYTGNIKFTYEALFDEWDATNFDSGGTFSIYIKSGSEYMLSEALTFGTDTESDDVYSSGQDLYIVCESTEANVVDIFSYHVVLPYATYLAGPSVQGRPIYVIQWHQADGDWVANFKAAQETTATMVGYTDAGIDWSGAGTDTYTVSADKEYMYGELIIAISADDDGLFTLFDPSENEWDKLWIEADLNCTLANRGLFIVSPGWTEQENSADYFYCLSDHISTFLVEVSEEGQFINIRIPMVFYSPSGDLDTSGSGDVIITFNFKAASCYEDAFKDSWDSDTDTLNAVPTLEQVEFTDG